MSTVAGRPETKTEKFLKLWRAKLYTEGLKIVQSFRLGFSKEEKDIIKIAHEMQTGNARFYEQLGYDKQETFDQAIEIITNQYRSQL